MVIYTPICDFRKVLMCMQICNIYNIINMYTQTHNIHKIYILCKYINKHTLIIKIYIYANTLCTQQDVYVYICYRQTV